MIVSLESYMLLQTGQGALTPLQAANSTASVVKYGTSASSLTSTANGSSTTYSQVHSPACMPYLLCYSEASWWGVDQLFACLLSHTFSSLVSYAHGHQRPQCATQVHQGFASCVSG